jgi:potassium-transporting ATPase KdpC subunit
MENVMITYLRPAIVLVVLCTIVTGLAYPFAMTGLAQLILPVQANGSLVERDGKIAGSALIGQSFTTDRYFHARPSAAGQNGYDAANSSGSNLGPLSKKLLDRVAADVQTLRGSSAILIPADAVTTSASGLDPHISPAYAALQVERVAKARGVDRGRVNIILKSLSERPTLGIVGEPKVNVFLLNLALDAGLAQGNL